MQAKWLLSLVASVCFAQHSAAQTSTYESIDSRGFLGPTGFQTRGRGVSANGRYVLFATSSPHFDASASMGGAFVRDRSTGALELVSVAPTGAPFDLSEDQGCAMTPDARYVAFTLGNRVYRRDRTSATTAVVSVSTSGAASFGFGPVDISDDGRFVVFMSAATDLVAGDVCLADVFVRDLQLGTTQVCNVSSSGLQTCGIVDMPAISGDGRYVAFQSSANLLPGLSGTERKIYLRDLSLATTELISQSTGGVSANDVSEWPFVSRDGRWVTFTSSATNLAALDTGSLSDVYVRDRQLGTTELVSPGDALNPPYGFSYGVAPITSDGRLVAFTTNVASIAPNDINGTVDVVVRDMTTGSFVCASQRPNGTSGNHMSYEPRMTADGRWIVFSSQAENLTLTAPTHFGGFNVIERDMSLSSAPTIATYCTAKVNSLGCTPFISSTGKASAGGETLLFVLAENVLPHAAGNLVWSFNSASTPFHGGTLCVAAPLRRTAAQDSLGQTGDCSGTYSFRFDASYIGFAALVVGQQINAQYYQRDGGFAWPDNVGLTNGLRFSITP
jgi:Tol biopolymer transport system component